MRITSLLLLLLPLSLYSQFYLNQTIEETKQAVHNSKYKVSLLKLNYAPKSGDSVLVWRVEELYMNFMVFFKDGISYMTVYQCLNKAAENANIQTCNDYYVRISDTEWRAYLGSNIYTIELMEASDLPTFYFTKTGNIK